MAKNWAPVSKLTSAPTGCEALGQVTQTLCVSVLNLYNGDGQRLQD